MHPTCPSSGSRPDRQDEHWQQQEGYPIHRLVVLVTTSTIVQPSWTSNNITNFHHQHPASTIVDLHRPSPSIVCTQITVHCHQTLVRRDVTNWTGPSRRRTPRASGRAPHTQHTQPIDTASHRVPCNALLHCHQPSQQGLDQLQKQATAPHPLQPLPSDRDTSLTALSTAAARASVNLDLDVNTSDNFDRDLDLVDGNVALETTIATLTPTP